jgi:hypothetical protein
MSKEEKIKEAYGEYWEYFKNKQYDENGFSMFEKEDDNHEIWRKILLETHPYANRVYRPISLKGIENNNGWNKIESESDLPKFTIQYHVVKNGSLSKAYYRNNNRWIVDGNDYPKTSEIHGITHYQEIVIPQPPIY